MEEFDNLLEAFKFLSSPFDEKIEARSSSETPVRPEDIIQNITEYCLKHVDFLESSKPLINENEASPDSSWKLACVILSMLAKLKDVIENIEEGQSEEERSIDVLSIQSRIIVQKSVELVVGFGIVPYLLPGIGVPEKLRKVNKSVQYFLIDAQAASPYDQFLRLSHSLEILLLCSSRLSLNALIVSKYASDILAGLLQICKAPIARPKPEEPQRKPGALSVEEYNNVISVRTRLSSLMINTFFINLPQSVLINSLFLIGATEKPRWVRTVCNELLSDLILSKNGLILVSTTMIESSARSDTWKLKRVIANLMKSALVRSGNPQNHEKLRLLSEQCYRLILQNERQETLNEEDDITGDSGIDNNAPETIDSDSKYDPFRLPYGVNSELINIGLLCALTLMEFDFELVKCVFWNKLFSQVLKLGVNKTDFEILSQKRKVSVSIKDIALNTTYGEFVLSFLKPLNVCLPLKLLQPVWSLFFQIFVACERYLLRPVQEPDVAASAEQLRHKLMDIMILLFEVYGSGSGHSLSLNTSTSENSCGSKSSGKVVQAMENVDLCDFCMMLLLNKETENVPVFNTFEIQQFDNGGQTNIHITRIHREVVSSTSNYNEVFENYLEISCLCLSSKILKSEQMKGIWPQLFRQLLAWGTKKQSHSQSASVKHKNFRSDEMPTRLNGDEATVCINDCQRYVTFKLLADLGDEEAILDQFGNAESIEETLEFLELLLTKFTEEACSTSQSTTFDTSQLIMYALGIIGALVEATSAATSSINQANVGPTPTNFLLPGSLNKEIHETWEKLEIFIPHLRKLSDCLQPDLVRQGVPDMANNLLLNIGTRGKYGGKSSKTYSSIKTRFQLAMEDASNPMVHVKGHGLLELRRLIVEGDAETMKHDSEVLKVFQNNLSNDDSYVYLMSIQGMAGLGLKFHKTIVPLLIKEYDFVDSDLENAECLGRKMYEKLGKNEWTETRMKVGEILVKVIQKLGEFAPSYRGQLTNVFFRLMTDGDPWIRASALSNLGELCHLLRFSLGIILTEVWFCVESILNTDKDLHVRRAALHLIVLLLKGIEKDLTVADIMSDNVVSQHLRDSRRFLTHLEQTEMDLVAKTHCQLALGELELIVKKLLTPNSSLTYKIQILDFSK